MIDNGCSRFRTATIFGRTSNTSFANPIRGMGFRKFDSSEYVNLIQGRCDGLIQYHVPFFCRNLLQDPFVSLLH